MQGIGGKYLTFPLGREEYGISITKVKEIIGMMEITAVPRMPGCIKGVINLRGKIIPLLDLRLKFSLEERPYTERTCIIVVEMGRSGHGVGRTMGVVVDAVSEVVTIAEGDIELPPQYGGSLDVSFLLGMGKVKGKVVLLLDIEKVLSVEELETIREMKGV